MEFTKYKTNFDVELPRADKDTEVEKYKSFDKNNKVKAYSLNQELKIEEGLGWIESDGGWNYHNNYDNSEDVMWFRIGDKVSKGKWFTTSMMELNHFRKENIKRVRLELNNILQYLD